MVYELNFCSKIIQLRRNKKKFLQFLKTAFFLNIFENNNNNDKKFSNKNQLKRNFFIIMIS